MISKQINVTYDQLSSLMFICMRGHAHTFHRSGSNPGQNTWCSCDHATLPKPATYIGLAKTTYIRCIYGILGREITKYTVIYGVYIRSWPTLNIYNRYISLQPCLTLPKPAYPCNKDDECVTALKQLQALLQGCLQQS